MKKSNFVGSIWLIGKEEGHIVACIDTATLSNETLKIILAHWKDIGREAIYDLRF